MCMEVGLLNISKNDNETNINFETNIDWETLH